MHHPRISIIQISRYVLNTLVIVVVHFQLNMWFIFYSTSVWLKKQVEISLSTKMNGTVLLQLFLIKIHEFPGKGDLRICKLSLSKMAIHSFSPRSKMTHVFNGVLFLLGRCRDDFKMYIHIYIVVELLVHNLSNWVYNRYVCMN